MPPLQAVLFDLDGTLVDTREDIAQCLNFTLKELGRPLLSLEQVVRLVGDGVRPLLSKAAGIETPEDVQKALSIFLPFYFAHCTDRARLYPEVLETLRRLRGVPMGVVSNKPQAHTEKTLRDLGLEEFFLLALGGDALPQRKPEPEPVWEALRRLGVQREGAVLVGDSGIDIETARRAGIPVWAVTWGFRPEEELRRLHPDRMVTRFSEIGEWALGEGGNG